VASRHPLWEDRLQQHEGEGSHVDAGLVLDHGREAIGTSSLDATPDIILRMPRDSYAPVILALTATTIFIGLAFHLWWLAALGALATGVDIIGWLWPERALGETKEPAING
jgi:cytochrome c oxidase subunit 1/cytochrome c oxidase subunit I+III